MKAWLRRLFGAAPEPEEWMIQAGDEAGHPVVVRTRTRPPRGMSLDAYPASVEIVWRFDGAAQNGMPTSDLAALMDECDGVLHRLEGPTNGMLGLAITGNNRREWVWYVADPETFAIRVRALQTITGDRFPIEVHTSTGPQP